MKNEDALVLAKLLENKDRDINISNLAVLLKKDYKVVYEIVKRLEEMSLLSLKRFGKSCKIELVEKIHPLIFEAEFLRKEELLKDRDLRAMFDCFFRGMNSSMYVLLVFGSYAKRKNTKNSDIDLMFIVPDSLEKEFERKIAGIAEIVPLNLHVNIFSESDFRLMKNSKELTVGAQAIKNNIILHGIEQYYELMR